MQFQFASLELAPVVRTTGGQSGSIVSAPIYSSCAGAQLDNRQLLVDAQLASLMMTSSLAID